MQFRQSFVATFLVVAFPFAALFGSSDARSTTVFDQLNAHGEILEVTLETDLDALEGLRKTNDKQRALFTYERADGSTDEYLINVKVRGKFRRRVCDFAPLMLKFPKKDLERRGLSKHNDIKLVTHCIDDPVLSKEQVLREYLAYQLYADLTPASYRTQLVKITYRDSDSNRKMKRWGFLIEDTDEMAERVGGTEADILNCEFATVNQQQEDLMTAFNLMIGNQDYSVGVCRNVKLVEMKDGSESIPVPYDFDFSGLVNATYAIPNPDYGTANMRDRVYIGRAGNADMAAAVLQLRQKRAVFQETIRSTKQLTTSARHDAGKYVDSFFEIEDFRGLLAGQILPHGEEVRAAELYAPAAPSDLPARMLTVPGK